MIKLNLVLWVFSLVLQGVLLVILVTRGIFRRVPVFTTLVAFYILRSITLYFISGYVDSPFRILIFSGLATVDVLLQTIVAWELFSAIVCSPGKTSSSNSARSEGQETVSFDILLPRRLAIFSLFLISACGFAFVGSILIHANPRALIDRSILFTSALFIGVFVTSLARKTPPQIQRLVQGFASYASASIVCQIGRTIAGAQHNGAAYNRWSYAESAAYVIVILFWVIVLPKESPKET